MLNKILLIGNLTKDPEGPRQAGQGVVTTFRLAVNERFGEGRERTLFIDVDCWGRTAELVAEYLRKGRRAFVEGRLQLDEWGDGEERRSKYKVVANSVRFLDGRGGGDGEDGGGDYDEHDDRSAGGGYTSRGSSSGGGSGSSGRDADAGKQKSRLPDYGLDEDIPF